MSAKIRLANCDPSELGVVPSDKVFIFLDSTDNILKVKKDDGTIKNLEDTDVLVAVSSNDTDPGYLEDKVDAGAGIQLQVINEAANERLQVIADVQSVFGRTGNVVAEAGDYGAILITFDDTAAGVNGATVQAAIDDLGARLLTIEGSVGDHLDGGANKHDATEIDYERTNASKKDIQGSSVEVEAALNDLDDFKLSITGSIPMTGDLDMGAQSIINVNLVDGRDLEVDGAKLDGIEAGATADQIASEVPVTPVGNLTADDVQEALEEHQNDIDLLNSVTYVNSFNGRTGAVRTDMFQTTQNAAQTTINAQVPLAFPAPNQTNVATYSFNNANSQLTILRAGKYKFTVICTADTNNNARKTSLIKLERFDGVSTFVEIPTSEGQGRAYGYHRNAPNGEDTMIITAILDVTANQIFRPTAECPSPGAIDTIPGGTTFIVEEI